MLRKKGFLLLTTVSVMLPTMSLAWDGWEITQGGIVTSGGRDNRHAPASHERDFGGDPRFRIGTNYGLKPYDYMYQDYNFYDYPYAHDHRRVEQR